MNAVRIVTRGVMTIILLLCFAISQVAGWSVFSTNFADGSVRRQVQATSGATAREEVDRLRALTKKTGLQRPVGTIEAEIEAALRTVVRGTGKSVGEVSRSCAEPAAAPTVCRQVGVLRAEIATAREAADLPKRLEAALARLNSAPTVAEGDPYIHFIGGVFGGADPATVWFWLVLVFVAGIGIAANVGPGLVRLIRHEQSGLHSRLLLQAGTLAVAGAFFIETGANALFGWRIGGWPAAAGFVVIAVLGALLGVTLAEGLADAAVAADRTAPRAPALLPPAHAAAGFVSPPAPQSPGGGGPAGGPHWGPPAGPGPGTVVVTGSGQPSMAPGAAHHMHGAPINITVSSQPAGAASPGGFSPFASPGEAAAAEPGRRAPAPAPAAAAELLLPTPKPPARPVTTNKVRELLDHVRTFEAAELQPAPGGRVDGEAVWQRYQQWAGGRSISRSVLFDMLGELGEYTRRADFGGAVGFDGVVLRGTPALRLVAGE